MGLIASVALGMGSISLSSGTSMPLLVERAVLDSVFVVRAGDLVQLPSCAVSTPTTRARKSFDVVANLAHHLDTLCNGDLLTL